jgi:hypothetical protein
VPVPSSLVDPLARQVAGKSPEDLVFTSPEGGVLRAGNFRELVFDPAARDAGLPGLTPHELRHTPASLAVSAGADVKAVERLLVHASAAMTPDVYSGLFDDDLDAVAGRLDEAAARARADSVRNDRQVRYWTNDQHRADLRVHEWARGDRTHTPWMRSSSGFSPRPSAVVRHRRSNASASGDGPPRTALDAAWWHTNWHTTAPRRPPRRRG